MGKCQMKGSSMCSRQHERLYKVKREQAGLATESKLEFKVTYLFGAILLRRLDGEPRRDTS